MLDQVTAVSVLPFASWVEQNADVEVAVASAKSWCECVDRKVQDGLARIDELLDLVGDVSAVGKVVGIENVLASFLVLISDEL